MRVEFFVFCTDNHDSSLHAPPRRSNHRRCLTPSSGTARQSLRSTPPVNKHQYLRASQRRTQRDPKQTLFSAKASPAPGDLCSSLGQPRSTRRARVQRTNKHHHKETTTKKPPKKKVLPRTSKASPLRLIRPASRTIYATRRSSHREHRIQRLRRPLRVPDIPTMAPRGPRSSNSGRDARGSALNAKPSSRGGIQKRKGPSRVDDDGDLDMDAAGKRPRTTPGSTTTRSGPAPRSAATRNPRGVSRAAQNVMKHLRSGDSSALANRVSDSTEARAARARGRAAGLTYLRIHGLRQSKAASNKDGGLSDLLSFLERKASSLSSTRRARPIMISKVSRSIDEFPGCRRAAYISNLQRFQATEYF